MKKILLILFFVLNTIAFISQGQTKNISSEISIDNHEDKTYAIIIGISNYKDARIEKLSYSRDDASNFFQFLTSKYCVAGIDEKNIIRLYDEDAQKRDIINAIENICNTADYNSTLYFYYSGHGSPNYLLPNDINFNDASTLIGYDYLVKKINSSGKFKNKIIVLDACFSGSLLPFIERDCSPDEIFLRQSKMWKERTKSNGGYVVFASSSKNSTSLEQRFGGLFTKTFIQGLKCNSNQNCADKNHDGKVTSRELYDYLYDKLNTSVPPVFKGNEAYPMSIVSIEQDSDSDFKNEISDLYNLDYEIQNTNMIDEKKQKKLIELGEKYTKLIKKVSDCNNAKKLYYFGKQILEPNYGTNQFFKDKMEQIKNKCLN